MTGASKSGLPENPMNRELSCEAEAGRNMYFSLRIAEPQLLSPNHPRTLLAQVLSRIWSDQPGVVYKMRFWEIRTMVRVSRWPLWKVHYIDRDNIAQ